MADEPERPPRCRREVALTLGPFARVGAGSPRLRAFGVSGLAALLMVLLLLFAVACGGSRSNAPGGQQQGANAQGGATHNTASGQCKRFPKTRFALHAGLAFGAFHRYVWKPYRAGRFSQPQGRKRALVKAGLASAFAYHETKVALRTAQCSPTLSRLVAPLTSLQARLAGMGPGLKQGRYNPGELNSTNGAIGSLHSESASAGEPITERTPASLGR